MLAWRLPLPVPKAVRNGNITHEARPQDRNTEAEDLEPVYQVLGHTVGLDPCSNPESIVRARRRIMLPECGLRAVWGGSTTVFMNPPFEDLGLWLFKAWWNATFFGCDVIALIPVRSHRVYWWPVWAADRVVFTPALSFGGLGAKAPFACIYVLWSKRQSVRDRFDRAFASRGHLMPLTGLTNGAMLARMENDTTNPLTALRDEFTAGLEGGRRQALIALVAGRSDLSILTLRKVLGAEDMEIIESLPLCELGSHPTPLGEAISAVGSPGDGTASWSGSGKPKPRARRKAPPKPGKKKAAKKAARASAPAQTSERGQVKDDIILRFIAKNTGCSKGAIMEQTGISPAKVRRSIERMLNDGSIVREGNTRNATYSAA